VSGATSGSAGIQSSGTRPTRTVLITDHAWPDISIERRIVEAEGFALVAGPAAPAPADAITELVRQHQPSGIMTCWAPISASAIAASRELKIVARLGVGLDNIAVDEATRQGVWVTNVPDYCVEEVSDHAVAMLLAWARGISHFDRDVKAGHWNPASARLRRVRDLTCGIIGFGRIGRRTTEKLLAFGVRILAHARSFQAADHDVQPASLDDVLRRSDVIIVHAPLTSETHHLLDRKRLGMCKDGAFLINVSRGAIVDNAALIEALESGRLCGAALDVLEGEPQVPRALLRPNVVLTPHVAFSSDASLEELRRRASEEIVRVLRGETPREARNALRRD
jgi:D-3-phosphoglycerate dehydrogenase